MNKIILILFGLSILFLIPQNTQAGWYGLPRCEDSFLGWVGLCCQDECHIGEIVCKGDYQMVCGDYDTYYDWDQCYEFPQEDSLAKYCPYGCEIVGAGTPICWTSPPDPNAQGCSEGETRCGGDGDDIIECVYNPATETWGWGVGNSVVNCRLTYGTQCVDGVCQDANEYHCSTCAPRKLYCRDDNVAPCLRNPVTGCLEVSNNPSDFHPCPNGCIDGTCKDEDGNAVEQSCIIGDARCSSEIEDYLEFCRDTDSDGTGEWAGIEPAYLPLCGLNSPGEQCRKGRYCDFGCHIDQCNPDPTPDFQCDFVCTPDETRCTGMGEVAYCKEVTNAEGIDCPVWAYTEACASGECRNGACIETTTKGYIFEPQENIVDLFGFPGTPISSRVQDVYAEEILGLSGTNERLYTFISNVTVGTAYYIVEFNENGTVKNKFLVNESTGFVHEKKIHDLAFDGSKLWLLGINYDGSDNNMIYAFNPSSGAVSYNWSVSGNPYNGVTGFGAIAANETYVFLLNTSGINIYDHNGNYKGNFCLVGNNTGCASINHTYMYFDNVRERFYVLYEKHVVRNSAGTYYPKNNVLPSPLDWTYDTEVQEYDMSGLYYGTFDLDEGPPYNGITKYRNQFFFLETKTIPSVSPITNLPEVNGGQRFRFHVWYDIGTCKNECVNGSSKCTGSLKNYKVDCVENVYGCNEWERGLFNLENTQYCPYGCSEEWLNHKYIVATCNDNPSCTNVCNQSQTRCTADGRSYVDCVYRSPPYLIGSEQQCWMWDDDVNGTPCLSGICDPFTGQCEDDGNTCMAGDTKCFTVTADFLATDIPRLGFSGSTWYVGDELLLSCLDIDGDGDLEFDRWYTPKYCQWGCNESIINGTTNQTTASCYNLSGTFQPMKNSINELKVWFAEILFPATDPGARYALTGFLIIIFVIISTVSIDWRFGVAYGAFAALVTAAVNFMPFALIFLSIALSAIILYVKLSGGGNG